MITYLLGQAEVMGSMLTVITSGGVGYGVMVPKRSLLELLPHTQVKLFVQTVVKQDALELYGFTTWAERQLFHLLTSVSGVGPRTALQLLELTPAALTQAVQQADVSKLASIPRVGKKLAQKIIIELTSKLGSLQELPLGPELPWMAEVRAALESLGFASSKVDVAIQQLLQQPELIQASSSVLIKAAIQVASR